MDLREIGNKALGVVENVTKKEVLGITSISQSEKGSWLVLLDILERKAIPDSQDLIGEYEVSINKDFKIIGYKRIAIRKRSTTFGQKEAM